MFGITLPGLPKFARVTIAFFLMLIGVTYLVGVVNIYNVTHFSVPGAIEHLRGSEEKMIYAKEFGDLVANTHYHLGGWAMMFMWVLLIMFFTTYSPKLKTFFGAISFFMPILDMSGMWLTRYVSTGFVYLLLGAGFLMALTFGSVIVLDLVNVLWGKPRPATA